ncbi:MAG: UDP-N-acetylmuramoylalanine--D-glutamate ligase [Planctomycetota bacterium]|jgi:UDP-N-acetylmuramoylalanine--D-glutamate ligase
MLDVKQAPKKLDNDNYLILGIGVSGYATTTYLLRHGYQCRLQDNRQLSLQINQLKVEFPQLQIETELNFELIEWADTLVVSPGISIHQDLIRFAAAQGKAIVGDVELFAQLVEKPVIAITGSNGKTTVTTLVGEMIKAAGLKAAVGGNIGTPALDLLETEADYYVLELSSYQLETTYSLQPRVAAMLNLSEDHLDRYASYGDYIKAKQRIFHHAEICLVNADDTATGHAGDSISFSLAPNSSAEFKLIESDRTYLGKSGQSWLSVDELKISGRHNWANCLAAMAIADSIGLPREAVVTALKEFTGIAHRSQWVAEIDGVEWINDSKATNVGAARASIEGRDRPIILIAGGQSKSADMSPLIDVLKQRVKLVLLMGVDAEILRQAWQSATRIEMVADMRQAVTRAAEEAVSGDCVLLAPACASFDMYEKFEARGDDFSQQVRSLIDG